MIFSNPTPEVDDVITEKWLPLSKSKKFCLNIDDKLKCDESPDLEVFELWKDLLL